MTASTEGAAPATSPRRGGETIGERRIARIMAEEGLEARGRTKPRRRYSSYAGEVTEHPGNKVRQDFAAGLPNFLWLTDVTQFSIPAGKLYLSPVLDCFDGSIVSWTTSTSPNAEMANPRPEAAIRPAEPGGGPPHRPRRLRMPLPVARVDVDLLCLIAS